MPWKDHQRRFDTTRPVTERAIFVFRKDRLLGRNSGVGTRRRRCTAGSSTPFQTVMMMVPVMVESKAVGGKMIKLSFAVDPGNFDLVISPYNQVVARRCLQVPFPPPTTMSTIQLPDSLNLPSHLSAHKYFFVCTLTVAAWDTLVLSPRTWRLFRSEGWPLLKIVFHFMRIFMPLEFTVVGALN